MNKSNALPIRVFRCARLAFHLLTGTATILIMFRLYSKSRRDRSVAAWSAKLLRILDVRVRARGLRPRGGTRPVVLVANHVSWLDIHVLHALTPARFVAKSDMLAWPVIGRLAAAAGTLFVDRARRHDAARINQHIVDAFHQGDCVGIFPEGTTTYGDQLRKFHSSLLQPAIRHDALLIPVALRYLGDGGGVDRAVGYVGETTLLQSFLAVLARRTIRVRVAFLSPIEATGHTRRNLARRAEFAIAESLNIPAASKAPESLDAQAGVEQSGSVPTGIRYL